MGLTEGRRVRRDGVACNMVLLSLLLPCLHSFHFLFYFHRHLFLYGLDMYTESCFFNVMYPALTS